MDTYPMYLCAYVCGTSFPVLEDWENVLFCSSVHRLELTKIRARASFTSVKKLVDLYRGRI